MKSSLYILLVLIGSSSAISNSLAFPIVGDRAVFEITVQNSDSSFTYQNAMEVASLGPDAGMMTLLLQHTSSGQTRSSTTYVHTDTYTELADTVNHCAQAGGIKETITVQAGTFETCRINNFWFGNVPFALVKSVYRKGSVTETRVLLDYKAQILH